MRHIVLSEDGHQLASDGYLKLLVTSYFPESSRDREQGLFIAAMEQAEFNRVGPDDYHPSEIMQVAASVLEKRTAQLYLVGFVSIALIWLKVNNQTPSLNRASIIASAAANEFGKVTWRPALDPNHKGKESAVTSDPATIGRIFRRYRSVAHIWAAIVSSAEYLAQGHVWDTPPEVIGTTIKTCAAFQLILQNLVDTSAWNIWDVTRYFPSSLGDWPTLVPGNELHTWIEAGYANAVDQGLIKR